MQRLSLGPVLLIFLSVPAVLGTCVCQNLSVAEGCGPGTGPYTMCDYYQAVVDCDPSLCVSTAMAQRASCVIFCECAPNCVSSLLGNNQCDLACDTPTCGQDGGDCQTSTYSECTDAEMVTYEACFMNAAAMPDECDLTQGILDCMQPLSCGAMLYRETCLTYERAYPSCSYDCTANSGTSKLAVYFVLKLLLA